MARRRRVPLTFTSAPVEPPAVERDNQIAANLQLLCRPLATAAASAACDATVPINERHVMANHRALSTVCEGVINYLRTAYEATDLPPGLEYKVYVAKDFSQPISAGVSLFLYRVALNGTHRIPAGSPRHDGRRQFPQLPLDLHFLLTVWARSASLQHEILGWMMRTIEDTPVLTANLLNAVTPGVFADDETVEVVPGEMTNEDLFRLWETLADNVYQLSVPYLARNVRLDSARSREAIPPVERRTSQYEVPPRRESP